MIPRVLLLLLFSALCASCNAGVIDEALESSVLSFSDSISSSDVEKFKDRASPEGVYLIRKFTSGNLGGRGKELSRIVSASSITKEMEFLIKGQTPFNLKVLFPGVSINEQKKLTQYTLSADVCELNFDQWDPLLKKAIAPLSESAEGLPVVLATSKNCAVYAEAQLIDGILVGGFAVFKFSSGKSYLVSIIELL